MESRKMNAKARNTEIEIAQTALATLHDRLHVATKRVYDIAAHQQSLGYAVYVENDPKAHAELSKLNAENDAANAEVSNIKSAIAEADRRLARARDAASRDADKEHARTALATLESLLALGPKLDELVRHPHPEEGREFYSQADPPTCCQAAKLMAELVNEHLRALRLTAEASFPKSWHGAASKFDLEREFMKTIAAGWPAVAVNVAPRQKTVVMPGQAPRTPQFTKIINGWGAVIRKALAQYAQATEIAA
jgi:hypothetical protein